MGFGLTNAACAQQLQHNHISRPAQRCVVALNADLAQEQCFLQAVGTNELSWRVSEPRHLASLERPHRDGCEGSGGKGIPNLAESSGCKL